MDISINGFTQKFEVDSGVGFTLLPRKDFQRLNIKTQLQPASIAFRSYTKNILVPDGKVSVQVQYQKQQINRRIVAGKDLDPSSAKK